MRRAVPLLFCLFLSCGEKKYTAQECQSLELTLVKRCFGGNLTSDQYVGDLKCWPFSKPVRMRGIWVFGLETSFFVPNANTLKTWPPWQSANTHFKTDMTKLPEVMAAYHRDGTVAYFVDFLGRQSLCDNAVYGPSYSREVIVERFYSMRRVVPTS